MSCAQSIDLCNAVAALMDQFDASASNAAATIVRRCRRHLLSPPQDEQAQTITSLRCALESAGVDAGACFAVHWP